MTDVVKDPNPLVSELADDPDIFDLVEAFVSELPGRVAAMRQALAHQDFETLRRVAHQLKGAAGGYGFPTITDAARELESSTQMKAEIEELDRQFRKLTELCGRARASATAL